MGEKGQRPAEFVQLVSTKEGLFALDRLGTAWRFCGNRFGWYPLSKHRMLKDEQIKYDALTGAQEA